MAEKRELVSSARNSQVQSEKAVPGSIPFQTKTLAPIALVFCASECSALLWIRTPFLERIWNGKLLPKLRDHLQPMVVVRLELRACRRARASSRCDVRGVRKSTRMRCSRSKNAISPQPLDDPAVLHELRQDTRRGPSQTVRSKQAQSSASLESRHGVGLRVDQDSP